MKTEVRITIRIPPDADKFLSKLSKLNFTSKNAEIVRVLRESMQREVSASLKATTGQSA